MYNTYDTPVDQTTSSKLTHLGEATCGQWLEFTCGVAFVLDYFLQMTELVHRQAIEVERIFPTLAVPSIV